MGEREGEKRQCVLASCVPPTGNLACDPGRCPRLGIELETLWVAGQHSIHWATPARNIYLVFVPISGTEFLEPSEFSKWWEWQRLTTVPFVMLIVTFGWLLKRGTTAREPMTRGLQLSVPPHWPPGREEGLDIQSIANSQWFNSQSCLCNKVPLIPKRTRSREPMVGWARLILPWG